MADFKLKPQRFLSFLILFLVVLVGTFQPVSAQCGPATCYTGGCTNASPLVDFVFLIDVSYSMQPKINGVLSGLTKFAQGLSSKGISPKYSLVSFGGITDEIGAILQLQMTDDFGTFKTKLNSLKIQGNWEAGLESMRAAMGIAAVGNLGINYTSGGKKVYIVVTNEDSDPPVNVENLFSTKVSKTTYAQQTTPHDGVCFGSAAGSYYTITDISANTWKYSWQKEVDDVANQLIDDGSALYMFVAGDKSLNAHDVDPAQNCNAYNQYCNPNAQVQSSTYTKFDSSATLSQLKALDQSQSLQGQLLAAKLTARCFDVADTTNSNLIANFFTSIVADVSSCDPCLSYQCSGTQCLAPVNICGCDGKKGSTKVSDGHGGCCESSELDCAGYCSGGHDYDKCGVCTAGGSLFASCKKDCDGNYYLDLPANPTSKPAYSGLIYKTTCPNPAGYLLMNSDLVATYKSAKSTQALCDQFHTFGAFQGRSVCTLDADAYNSRYGTSLSQGDAESNYLASLLTASPRTATCESGTRVNFPPLTKDMCNQCVLSLDDPPFCVKDCDGNYVTDKALASFVDNCGNCVSAGTNPNASKDSCGVCNGNDSLKNECGVCNGPNGKDKCGQNVCLNLTCSVDCDGVSRNPSTMKLDECGNCVLISAGRDPKCSQDCQGTWYQKTSPTSAPHIVDECGNCVPKAKVRLPSCVKDCAGKYNGSATYDPCGQCTGGTLPAAPSCHMDCNGDFYLGEPLHSVDDCGICNTMEDFNSNQDACGICQNTANYDASRCTPDCKNISSLVTSKTRAFTDACGDCWFANQTANTNQNMDACGICWEGGASNPGWNSSPGGVDNQGQVCKCGQTPFLCSDKNTTTCSDNCPNYCPGTTQAPDECDRCPNNTLYNQGLDKCGVCCDPDNGILCNQDLDSCGVCFGFDRDRQNPCGICDPDFNTGHGKCQQDCSGVWGGNKTYGCNGECDFNGTCAVCGDGIKQPGEGCDLGTDASTGKNNNQAGSGCSSTCQVEAGLATGLLVGVIVGVSVAVVALGVAAFFAFRYAKKAGMVGKAGGKEVDFNATNNNPLYKGETQVHSNPLYQN